MLKRLFAITRLSLILIVVPLLLIATNVLSVVAFPYLYSYGFEKYDIVAYTGIEMEQLELAGQQIRDYFSNDDEWITIRVERHGEIVPNLFNEREILHMKDVKHLLNKVEFVQQISFVIIVIGILLGFLTRDQGHMARSVRSICRGGGLTLCMTVFVGILMVVGFQRIFILFHLVSFNNDLWILDARRDFLIMMFPTGFFFDATMLIALMTVVEGIVLWLVAPRILRKFFNI